MYDVIIIGTGPVGLFSAYYCGFHKLKTIALEHLPFSGGQLSNLYAEKLIYDIPGFSSITAGDFVAELEKQYAPFATDIPILYNQGVKNIEQVGDHFRVVTATDTFDTKTVLIATGEGEFTPRPLGVADSDQYTNVHYTLQLEQYRDKRVVVFGGGDSAVDFASMIDQVASETILVHRRHEFRAHAHSMNLLRSNTNVQITTPYQALSLTGTGNQVQLVTLEHTETGEQLELSADYFFVNFGFLPSRMDYNSWGIDASKQGIAVDYVGATNTPGIYAVGNCSVYPGKIKTIAVGLGEVPLAVTAIKRYLNPDKIVGTAYSSLSKKQ